jgi:hypothetical protein
MFCNIIMVSYASQMGPKKSTCRKIISKEYNHCETKADKGLIFFLFVFLASQLLHCDCLPVSDL